MPSARNWSPHSASRNRPGRRSTTRRAAQVRHTPPLNRRPGQPTCRAGAWQRSLSRGPPRPPRPPHLRRQRARRPSRHRHRAGRDVVLRRQYGRVRAEHDVVADDDAPRPVDEAEMVDAAVTPDDDPAPVGVQQCERTHVRVLAEVDSGASPGVRESPELRVPTDFRASVDLDEPRIAHDRAHRDGGAARAKSPDVREERGSEPRSRGTEGRPQRPRCGFRRARCEPIFVLMRQNVRHV